MKKMFMVTYDFNTGEIPQSFFDKLIGLGPWWHYINGTWLLSTEFAAADIYSLLQPYLDNNVHLLIAEMGPEMTGWLPKDAWDWIFKNRNNREEAVALVGTPTIEQFDSAGTPN